MSYVQFAAKGLISLQQTSSAAPEVIAALEMSQSQIAYAMNTLAAAMGRAGFAKWLADRAQVEALYEQHMEAA